MRRKSPTSLLLAAGLFLWPASAFADRGDELGPCLPGNIVICNTPIQMPANPIGFAAILTVPSPYIHQRFTVQCLGSHRGSFGYAITDSSAVTCALETCGDENVNICGYAVPVAGGSVVGNTQNVPVPAEYLAQAAIPKKPAFTAECVDVDGQPMYRVVNDQNVSCNDFACPDASFELCGLQVVVPGGAALGEVLERNLPPPFMPDPFRVQCLGSNGNAPVYEMMDHSAVTCAMAPVQNPDPTDTPPPQ